MLKNQISGLPGIEAEDPELLELNIQEYEEFVDEFIMLQPLQDRQNLRLLKNRLMQLRIRAEGRIVDQIEGWFRSMHILPEQIMPMLLWIKSLQTYKRFRIPAQNLVIDEIQKNFKDYTLAYLMSFVKPEDRQDNFNLIKRWWNFYTHNLHLPWQTFRYIMRQPSLSRTPELREQIDFIAEETAVNSATLIYDKKGKQLEGGIVRLEGEYSGVVKHYDFPVEISQWRAKDGINHDNLSLLLNKALREVFTHIPLKQRPECRYYIQLNLKIKKWEDLSKEDGRQFDPNNRDETQALIWGNHLFNFAIQGAKKGEINSENFLLDEARDVAQDIRRQILLQIARWQQEYGENGDNVHWEVGSMLMTHVKFMTVAKRARINNIIVPLYEWLKEAGANFPVGCGRELKCFHRFKILKVGQVLKPGLCLWESFWIAQNYRQAQRFTQTQLAHHMERDLASITDKRTRDIFYSTSLIDFIAWIQEEGFEHISVWHFYCAEWMYQSESLEVVIIVKDGHVFPVMYNEELPEQLRKMRDYIFEGRKRKTKKKKRHESESELESGEEEAVVQIKFTDSTQGIQIIQENFPQSAPFYYVFDFETYNPETEDDATENLGNQVPFTLCVKDQNQRDYVYWGEKTCVDQFMDWFDEEIIGKRDGEEITFYAFNGSKFDFIFLLSPMIIRYSPQIIGSYGNIKQIKIGKVEFLDLRLQLGGGSLNSWCKELFGIQKKEFTHNVRKADLQDPAFKDKAIEYCLHDCYMTQRLQQAMALVYRSQGITKDNWITSTQMTYACWKKQLKKGLKINGVPSNIYPIMQSTYYGGYTQCFKKEGGGIQVDELDGQAKKMKVVYVDINSAYPESMRKHKYPIKFIGRSLYGERVYEEDDESIEEDKTYQVIAFQWRDGTHIPFFPVRSKEKKGTYTNLKQGLYYPLESTEVSYRWGFEIKNAFSKGLQSITLGYSYEFENEYIFQEYIEQVYNERLKAKAEGKKDLAAFLKLKMNSLYGKLGQELFPLSMWCSRATLYEVLQIQDDYLKVKDIKYFGEGVEEVALITFTEDNYNFAPGSCVQIPSKITAKTRMLLVDYIFHILEKTGRLKHLLYLDTDSIQFEIPEEDDPMTYLAGICDENELGKLKIEHIGKYGIYLGSKMYFLEWEGGYTAHFKGVHHELFHFDHVNKGMKESEYIAGMGLSKEEYKEICNNRQSQCRALFELGLSEGELKFENQIQFKKGYAAVSVNKSDKNIHMSNRRIVLQDGTTVPYRNLQTLDEMVIENEHEEFEYQMEEEEEGPLIIREIEIKPVKFSYENMEIE